MARTRRQEAQAVLKLRGELLNNPKGTYEEVEARFAKTKAAAEKAQSKAKLQQPKPIVVDSLTKFEKVSTDINWDKEVVVSARIPRELAEAIKAQLKEVGSTIDDFIRIAIKAHLRVKTVYGLGDKIAFGKYKGETINSLIRNTPKYILWCIDNTEMLSLTPPAQKLLEELLGEDKSQAEFEIPNPQKPFNFDN